MKGLGSALGFVAGLLSFGHYVLVQVVFEEWLWLLVGLFVAPLTAGIWPFIAWSTGLLAGSATVIFYVVLVCSLAMAAQDGSTHAPTRDRSSSDMKGDAGTAYDRGYSTPEVLTQAAAEDPKATQLAQMAMQAWQEDLMETVIKRVAERTGTTPPPQSVFVDAYATVRAVKNSVNAGELPGNTEGIYNEIRIIGQEQVESGLPGEWAAVFWLLRQRAAVLAFRAYLGDTPALEHTLKAWEAAEAKLQSGE